MIDLIPYIGRVSFMYASVTGPYLFSLMSDSLLTCSSILMSTFYVFAINPRY